MTRNQHLYKSFDLKVFSSSSADMAVTRSSDANQSSISRRHLQPIEEEVEVFDGDDEDVGACGLIKQSELYSNHGQSPYKGPSTRPKGIDKNMCRVLKMFQPRRTRTKEQDSDSLSDIDDLEVSSYLNSKGEMLFKQALWEAENKDYAKAKKPKRKVATKKDLPAKKAAKISEKVDFKKPNPKINYDALKMLEDELRQGSETGRITSADDSGSHRNDEFLNGNTSKEMHQSIYSGDEDWCQRSYCQDDENFYGQLDDEDYEDYESCAF